MYKTNVMLHRHFAGPSVYVCLARNEYYCIFSTVVVVCMCTNSTLSLCHAAVCPPTQTVSGMLSGLESSGWLKHIHLIMEVAVFTAKVGSRFLFYNFEGINKFPFLGGALYPYVILHILFVA